MGIHTPASISLSSFQVQLRYIAMSIDEMLEILFTKELQIDPIKDAHILEVMKYASLQSGKRIRPFLVAATAQLFEPDLSTEKAYNIAAYMKAEQNGTLQDYLEKVKFGRALRAGAAAEMFHVASLIQDDLPDMDNDVNRRGRPTTWKKFSPASAILASDALISYTGGILKNPQTHPDPEVRLELMHIFLNAMQACSRGQMRDILAEKSPEILGSLDEIKQLHELKTGEMLTAPCEAGGVIGGANQQQLKALKEFGTSLGLLYQIKDDIFDIARDEAQQKTTWVSYRGLENTKQDIQKLIGQCIDILKRKDAGGNYLFNQERIVPLVEITQFAGQGRQNKVNL